MIKAPILDAAKERMWRKLHGVMDEDNISVEEMDGIAFDECPDMVGAYVVAACWFSTGESLNDTELDELNKEHQEFVQQTAREWLYS